MIENYNNMQKYDNCRVLRDDMVLNKIKLDTIREMLINISKRVNDDLTVNILEHCYVQQDYFYVNVLDIQSFDLRFIYMACHSISMLINSVFSIDSKTIIVYHKNDIYIILKEIGIVKKQYNFKIPYKNWDDYIEFVHEINQLVESEGSVILFVNNYIYNLDCCLHVHTQNDKVLEAAQKYNVGLLGNGKSSEHYIQELVAKNWTMYTLIPKITLEDVRHIMTSGIFLFAPQKELSKRGYHFQETPLYEKVFISYSHKDSDIVSQFEEELITYGIPVWKDTLDIDFGDNITQKITEGMAQSRIFILCISKHTLNSLYAKQELITLYNNMMIYQKDNKRAIILKLDDTDLDSIVMGLNNFKYAVYANQEEREKLIQLIKRELSSYD